MGKTFFSADLHFGHKGILNYCDRPFKDVDHMTNVIVEYHNSIVGPEDTVYILGDFSMNPKWAKRLVPLLNGNLYLIPGNHDACFIGHKKHEKMRQKYLEAGFKGIYQWKFHTLSNGENVFLSHLPYAADYNYTYDDRYIEHRLKDTGTKLLCGHVHEAWVKLENQVNVGIDAHNMKYLTEDAVIKLLADPRKFIPVKTRFLYKVKKWWKGLKKVI
jgi:calcineurin-like phosphoesterase family protein